MAANKGAQSPRRDTTDTNPISWFALPADPLNGAQWVEHELTRVIVPINSQPIDLDSDGDLDVVGGSRMERRVFWFENLGGDEIRFDEHRIDIDGGEAPVVVTEFNLDFVDFSGDGQLDIVLRDSRNGVVWLEQPVDPTSPWRRHPIGELQPDVLVGFVVADINDDGNPDVMAGAYSQGQPDQDGNVTAESAVGGLRGSSIQPERVEGGSGTISRDAPMGCTTRSSPGTWTAMATSTSSARGGTARPTMACSG